MRTPNCECLVCGKPMYRRPYELAKVRHVACMEHRAEAQKISGITEKQNAALSLGRQKGTNHREGYKHREESKQKCSQSHKTYCANNPEKVAARGEKIRGENGGNWKGGISRLNTSIRQMTENRKWMDAVKFRDKACVKCGSVDNLESHHIVPLSSIIENLGILNRDDARKHKDVLWDLSNGVTLCRSCHYAEHGRTVNEN